MRHRKPEPVPTVMEFTFDIQKKRTWISLKLVPANEINNFVSVRLDKRKRRIEMNKNV